MVAHHCAHCQYTTTRKYNMERHSIMVHNILYIYKPINTENVSINEQKTIIDEQKTIIDEQKTIIDEPKTIIDEQKTIIDDQLETNNNICIKCNKSLSCKSSLNRHILICKRVINPLECYICHKIFTTTGNKSRHIKYCTSKALIPIDTNNNTTTNNTITNNNTIDTINNNITNNINTNNINNSNNTNNILQNNNIIINFGTGTDQIEFKNDHIDESMINDMYKSGNIIEGLRQYIIKTFEEPSNRLIKNKCKI